MIIVSNALDDATRIDRGISTDSPAASRKVLMLCKVLRAVGVKAYVLSLGRGRADGSWSMQRSLARRVDGVPVIYAPFSRVRVFSELLSLFAPAWLLLRLRPHSGPRAAKVVLFYNRLGFYVPTLLVARFLGFRTMFDLEDGEVGDRPGILRSMICRLYDSYCASGALLACSALGDMTSVQRVHCYYGTALSGNSTERWKSETITVILGGTLSEDTGVHILVDAIRQLRETLPPWAALLRFEITGKGPALESLKMLANQPGMPQIVIRGRTLDAEYSSILSRCEVGLALKPRGGPLANTTFPSKVVEMASAGLLVITTDISDVRKVLGGGALYLEQEDAAVLTEMFHWILENRDDGQALARVGMEAVLRYCEPEAAGRAVAEFIFEGAQ